MECPNPDCEDEDAYVGALFVECPNPDCQHYSEKQFNAVSSKRFKERIEEDIAKYRHQGPDDTPTRPLVFSKFPSMPGIDIDDLDD